MTINSPLAPFLQAAAATTFEWGKFDCGLWLADWVRIARGLDYDPAEAFRGKYSTAQGAASVLRKSGYGATVQAIADRCGLEQTIDPMRGDIGLVLPVKHRLTGAIRGAKGWVLLTPDGTDKRGISLAPECAAQTVAAWKV